MSKDDPVVRPAEEARDQLSPKKPLDFSGTRNLVDRTKAADGVGYIVGGQKIPKKPPSDRKPV